jgi:hypothetical protein
VHVAHEVSANVLLFVTEEIKKVKNIPGTAWKMISATGCALRDLGELV